MVPDRRRRGGCHRRGADAVDGARRVARAGRAAWPGPRSSTTCGPGSPTVVVEPADRRGHRGRRSRGPGRPRGRGPVLAVQVDAPSPATGADRWAALASWSQAAPPGRVLVLPATTDGRTDPAVAHALRGRPVDRPRHAAGVGRPGHGGAGRSAGTARPGSRRGGHRGRAAPSGHLLRPPAQRRPRRRGPGAAARAGATRPVATGGVPRGRPRCGRPPTTSAGEPGIVDLGLRDPSGRSRSGRSTRLRTARSTTAARWRSPAVPESSATSQTRVSQAPA